MFCPCRKLRRILDLRSSSICSALTSRTEGSRPAWSKASNDYFRYVDPAMLTPESTNDKAVPTFRQAVWKCHANHGNWLLLWRQPARFDLTQNACGGGVASRQSPTPNLARWNNCPGLHFKQGSAPAVLRMQSWDLRNEDGPSNHIMYTFFRTTS